MDVFETTAGRLAVTAAACAPVFFVWLFEEDRYYFITHAALATLMFELGVEVHTWFSDKWQLISGRVLTGFAASLTYFPGRELGQFSCIRKGLPPGFDWPGLLVPIGWILVLTAFSAWLDRPRLSNARELRDADRL